MLLFLWGFTQAVSKLAAADIVSLILAGFVQIQQSKDVLLQRKLTTWLSVAIVEARLHPRARQQDRCAECQPAVWLVSECLAVTPAPLAPAVFGILSEVLRSALGDVPLESMQATLLHCCSVQLTDNSLFPFSLSLSPTHTTIATTTASHRLTLASNAWDFDCLWLQCTRCWTDVDIDCAMTAQVV